MMLVFGQRQQRQRPGRVRQPMPERKCAGLASTPSGAVSSFWQSGALVSPDSEPMPRSPRHAPPARDAGWCRP